MHKTIFSGEKTQKISFKEPSGVNGFDDNLELQNNDINFATPIYNVKINQDTQLTNTEKLMITGTWKVDGLEGVEVTTYAFQNGLPFPAEVSSFILMLCLVFFAFTTILGWDYYSERCLEYLSGGKMKSVKVFRWIYIFAVFIGPYMTVSAVWTIADIFNGLMALPNMIALFALSGVVAKETKKFFEKHNKN
mgnify:CR=1 FL=1